ncbi:MAG: hypothetical protein JRI91_13790, partial [Deltaproteobacteria bacterium]|nr:hypothetical protein [Deltaproteobacteria bacterium]
LISNYLKGYEEIKDFVGVENKRVEYSDGNFSEHKTFVGDDSLSVYLKDIELEIDSEILEENIEVADCQGSDSPNPLHLAMIQDYLVLAHFIVYVVSSRIGLREADIRFLSMIKKMGICDNILFIVNFDFNEHDSVNDLNALVEKIRQEISIIRPNPKLFTLSSLFNLFKSQKTSLTHKDNERLAQWLSLEVFSNSSVREGKKFLKTFSQQIVNERFSLLLKNHLERLGVMAAGMGHWISINQDILSGDLNNAHKFLVKIKQHEEKIGHIKLLIRDTLDGAVQKLIDELKGEIDRFFSARSGEVVSNLLEFIRNYRVSYMDYGKKMEVSGFNNTLYLIFQDFKHAIDRFITESINPQIIKFIREKEDHISKFLESVSLPYERMVLDTLDDYNDTVKDFDILPIHVNHKPIEAPNMDSVKQVIGLKLPLAEATMRYSAKIKTGAIIHLGAYKMVNLIKKLFKKPVQNQREEAILALKGGVDRMKRETEKAMAYHFKNYRENIKFQYILRLVEGASNYFFDELKNRFQIYLTDLSQLIALVDDKGTSKEGTAGTLQEMEIMAKDIIQRVGQMRQRVASPTQ